MCREHSQEPERVAQLVEHRNMSPGVAGSSPAMLNDDEGSEDGHEGTPDDWNVREIRDASRFRI